MMFNFPFYPPFYRRYPRHYYNGYYATNKIAPPPKVCEPIEERSKTTDDDVQCFEILGIKLYFDDILLICLIFFLYNEGVKDQSLFLSLIMLLLS